MFKYDKYPMNAWIYGLSFLLIVLLPFLLLIGALIIHGEGTDGFELPFLEEFYEGYFSILLFPSSIVYPLLIDIPYFGTFLLISWFILHVHVYSFLIERFSILFRKRNIRDNVQGDTEYKNSEN